MAWLQLRVRSAHPEFAEEILFAQGAQAVSFTDAADDPVFEPWPGQTPLWRNTVAVGLFLENTDLAPALAALRELLPDGAGAEVHTELLEDQDWVRVWLDSWQPLRFGEHLWVTPREKIQEIKDPQAVIMRLDPGLAFGTGTHPTTALCLDWLERSPPKGLRVLDYGCGSGILAIAALLLGAQDATGVDIDPQALSATQQNADENGVGARISTLLPEAYQAFAADLVLANILANPLRQLAPLLIGSLKPGGRIVLSGLTAQQAAEVRAAYAPAVAFDADGLRDGWARLSGTRVK